MVLEYGGFGTLYQGDSEEFEISWATADGWIHMVVDGESEYNAEYSISGDTLTLLYEDGTVETWTAG